MPPGRYTPAYVAPATQPAGYRPPDEYATYSVTPGTQPAPSPGLGSGSLPPPRSWVPGTTGYVRDTRDVTPFGYGTAGLGSGNGWLPPYLALGEDSYLPAGGNWDPWRQRLSEVWWDTTPQSMTPPVPAFATADELLARMEYARQMRRERPHLKGLFGGGE